MQWISFVMAGLCIITRFAPAADQTQLAEIKKGVQDLPQRWDERWYSLVHKGVKVGWMHLKVEKQGNNLLLTDKFYCKPDRDNEITIASALTAASNEFLTPVALAWEYRSSRGVSGSMQIKTEQSGVSITYNGQNMSGDDKPIPKLPANLITDFALLRLVTLLPHNGGVDLLLFDTIQHVKPRSLEGRVLKFDQDEEIDAGGKKVKTRRYVLKAAGAPDQFFWVDDESRLVKFSIAAVEAMLTDKKSASAIDASQLKEAPIVRKNPPRPSAVPPLQGLPVFPGAEGFGTRTPAGRGGKIIAVTTLADSGPGSLREALDHAGPRIIVFRVSGTIELASELCINQPFVTVAGQTAPGGGITLKNSGITITTHDILIQHLRIRPGNEGQGAPDGNDAVALLGPNREVKGASNVVLDHITASWSEDEALSVWDGAHDITVCWSIVSEALSKSRHQKGKHSAGVLIGNASDRVSLHHTLMAHNGFRNPLVSRGGTHDIVNNVIYNWEDTAGEVYDPDANSFLNFIGNTFIAGPNSKESPFEIWVHDQTNTGKPNPRLFVKDNWGPRRTKASADEWSLVGANSIQLAPRSFQVAAPFKTWPLTISSAADALEKVLAEAGATRPARDAVDTRVVGTVKTRTGRIIDSPSDVGGYPKVAEAPAPKDSDHDGMPDDWETKHGLDPANSSDAKADRNGDGYTNIEEYLHSVLK